jgi:hypothetical protein
MNKIEKALKDFAHKVGTEAEETKEEYNSRPKN